MISGAGKKGSSCEYINSCKNAGIYMLWMCQSLEQCTVWVCAWQWYQIRIPVKHHIMCQNSVNLMLNA